MEVEVERSLTTLLPLDWTACSLFAEINKFPAVSGMSTAELHHQSVYNLKLKISWVSQHNSDQRRSKSGNQQQSVNGHILPTSVPLKLRAMI